MTHGNVENSTVLHVADCEQAAMPGLGRYRSYGEWRRPETFWEGKKIACLGVRVVR